MNKRTLGVDYGLARIGLALTDPGLTIASPMGYIVNKGPNKNLAPFAELIKKHNIGQIVLGLPLPCTPPQDKKPQNPHKQNTKEQTPRTAGNDTVSRVLSFGTWLENNFALPVIYQDERYSSCRALDEIREKMQIRDPKKIAELVDSVAASMILYDWLRKHQGGK